MYPTPPLAEGVVRTQAGEPLRVIPLRGDGSYKTLAKRFLAVANDCREAGKLS